MENYLEIFYTQPLQRMRDDCQKIQILQVTKSEVHVSSCKASPRSWPALENYWIAILIELIQDYKDANIRTTFIWL